VNLGDVQIVEQGPDALASILPLVRQYFEFDHLVYGRHVEEGVLELLQNPVYGRIFLAEVDGETVGYACLTFGFDHEAGGRLGLVTDLFLVEQARGKRYGAAILDKLVQFARAEGLKQIDLFVIEGNERAEALYSSRGFARVKGRTMFSLNPKAIPGLPG
jgi:GNAT superfamily N-acetyltransferase